MESSVYNIKGDKTERNIILNDAIFNIKPNDHAIYLDVKQFLANKRQGTHKSKERNEIAGSSKKLHKQKGTGGARRGNIKSPLLRGGGRVFGPRPRDYSFKLNKQVKHLARISALTYKAKNNSITVLEDFNFESPKTKNYSELLSNLGQTGKKTLFVLPKNNKNIVLSAKNIQRAKVITVSNLNTYDIMNANNLLLSESSVKELENQLLKSEILNLLFLSVKT
ncbi:MAG: 50S ribosomal protein L4 [Bacteroidota bacterium]